MQDMRQARGMGDLTHAHIRSIVERASILPAHPRVHLTKVLLSAIGCARGGAREHTSKHLEDRKAQKIKKHLADAQIPLLIVTRQKQRHKPGGNDGRSLAWHANQVASSRGDGGK